MSIASCLFKGSPHISASEFAQRTDRMREEMDRMGLDAMLVYGDEYRKENLRYVSNFWPIFERGALFIPINGVPIYAGAPEGEQYAREMCHWQDIRNLKEFLCVSVVDEIDYPLATISRLDDVVAESIGSGRRLGVVGLNDMPGIILDRIKESKNGLELVDASPIINKMRLTKSSTEIECLREAGRLACIGYRELMKTAIPGSTELEAAGAAEGATKMAGAEAISFMVFGSGARTNTIIGRPTNKVIEDGDMIMASLAVQYEGYVATVDFPFVAGDASAEQREFLKTLMEATQIAVDHMRPGRPMCELVKSVRDYFRRHDLSHYDVYPPMHGIGLAEAEAPYPDENSRAYFEPGMTINTDISLFGLPGVGGNRVEEGLLITDTGVESITPFIRELCEASLR
ncbi:MAG: M24 family metallopeptidase [Armatimonadota bacterium]